MTPDEIREQLRAAQAASGLTVHEWAAKSGVNRATIFRALDPNYQHVTSNKTLQKLLEAAGGDGAFQSPSPSSIRAARELKGWSQAALAEMVGTSQQTIDRLERGETGFSRYREPALKALGLGLGADGGDGEETASWPPGNSDAIRSIYHGVRGETRYPLKHWDDLTKAEMEMFFATYEVLRDRQRRIRGPGVKGFSYMLSPATLKAALDVEGRSQAALARFLGVEQSAVNRMVNGKREIKARELHAIQRYLAGTPGTMGHEDE